MSLNVKPSEIVNRALEAGTPGLLAAAPGWKRVSLGSLAKVVNGAPFPSRQFNTDGRGTPLIRIRDVGVDRPTTYFDGEFDKAHLVEFGDLLIGMDGDFRLARWRGPQALLNQRVCRLDITSPLVTRGWLEHILQGYIDAIWRETSSITVKHLSSRSIADIPLPLPPIEEQRYIVDILEDHLSRLDAANIYLDAAVKRQAGLTESAVGNLAELRTAERAPLGTVLAEPLRHGKSVPTADFGFPVLRLTAIREGRIDIAQRKIGAWSFEDAKPYLVQTNDFLVARGNGSRSLVGRGGLVVGHPDAVAFPDTVIRVRPEASALDAEFLAIVWDLREVRRQIEGAARTTAGIYKVNQADLRGVTVPVPTLVAQRFVVATAVQVVEWRTRLALQLHRATARSALLRKSLLQAAFTGRLTGSSTDTDIIEELAGV